MTQEGGVLAGCWASWCGVTGFPGGSGVKSLPANAGDPGSIPASGGENGNPLQYSCLEDSVQRSLAGCSPRGLKESDRTERLSTHAHQMGHTCGY